MIMDTIINPSNIPSLYCPFCLDEGKLSLLLVEIAHCKSEQYMVRIKNNARGFSFSRYNVKSKPGKFIQYFISCEERCEYETSFWTKEDLESELRTIKELLETEGEDKLQEALGKKEEETLSLFEREENSKKPKLLSKPKEILVLELIRSPLTDETET